MAPENPEQARYNWACLSKVSPTKVTGFIVDAVAYRLKHVFLDMGVTEEKDYVDKALRPGTHCPELETLDKPGYDDDEDDQVDDEDDDDGVEDEGADDDEDDYFHWWNKGKVYYHTAGSLDNVANLRCQTRPFPNGDCPRVMGLQIVHEDGLIETLGQWNPDDIGTIQEFYSSTDHGPLRGLRLTLNEKPLYILGITTGPEAPGTGPQVCRAYRRDEDDYEQKAWNIIPGWASKQPRALLPILSLRYWRMTTAPWLGLWD